MQAVDFFNRLCYNKAIASEWIPLLSSKGLGSPSLVRNDRHEKVLAVRLQRGFSPYAGAVLRATPQLGILELLLYILFF